MNEGKSLIADLLEAYELWRESLKAKAHPLISKELQGEVHTIALVVMADSLHTLWTCPLEIDATVKQDAPFEVIHGGN